jgi:penicillin-binding protein 1A
LVIGTYVGFDQPKTMGKMATGSSVALPIFINIMESEPFKEQKSLAFIVPDSITLIQKAPEENGSDPTATEAVKTHPTAPPTEDPFERLDDKKTTPENGGVDIY